MTVAKVAMVSLMALAMVLVPATVSAAPKGGGPIAECPSGKTYGELDKKECDACGGKWVVDAWQCGGGILGGSVATIGGLVTKNPFALIGGITALGNAYDKCKGSCEATT
jgi:hypothetical protein